MFPRSLSFLLGLSAILLLGIGTSCQSGDDHTAVQVPTYSAKQFHETVSVGGGVFNADNSKMMFTSNETGIFNAYEYDLATEAITPITQSDSETVSGISYFPQDQRVLYTSDQGGNENNHIYVRLTDGSTQDLTPYSGSKNSFWGFDRAGSKLYFQSNKRDPKYFDLYTLPINDLSAEPSLIFENNKAYQLNELSADERYLCVSLSESRDVSKLYLVDLTDGSMRLLSPEGSEANYSAAFFSLDSKELYYLTDEGADFRYLMKMNLASGESEKVFAPDWDVAYAYNSYHDKYHVMATNADAKTEIKIVETATGKEINIAELADSDITSVTISKDESLMSLRVGNSASPTDIYLYRFADQSLTRVTNSLNPAIKADHLVEGKVVRFKSFDGMEIPALYFEPKGASKDQQVPGIVYVHGGPGGQTRLTYRATIQHLVNHGYAVIAVNNRGSSGYGKAFFAADDKDHGGGDLQDCIYAKHHLASMGVVDTSRVAIVGGSYGGFMVMAALTKEPEAFDAGVDIYGVTNWLRTLRSIPPYWEAARKGLYKEMGDPFSADSVDLYNKSPLFFADQVTKPLMVLQGANDPRVLQIESDEIVAEVKKNNVPVEYVIFPDEGHGFRKKANRIKADEQMVAFLQAHL